MAAATDLPQVSTGDNITWYTIKNVRGNVYAAFTGSGAQMKLNSTIENESYLFYFTGGENGGYKIHNAATSNLCAGHSSWTAEGVNWYLRANSNNSYPGVSISNDAEYSGNTCWNNEAGANKKIAYWSANDDGSAWIIEQYTGNVDDLKLSKLQMSTGEEKHFYYIKNRRQNGKFANYVDEGKQFTQTSTANAGSYWYFVDATNELPQGTQIPEGCAVCRIFNAGNALGVENPELGLMAQNTGVQYPAKIYFIRKGEKKYWDYVIYPYTEATTSGWNDANGTHVTNYDIDDEGSIWSIEATGKSESDLIAEATTAKTNALAYFDLAEAADYFTYSDEAIAIAKAAVKDLDVATDLVTATTSHIAIESAISTLKGTETNAGPAAGDYVILKNRQYGSNYMGVTTWAENNALCGVTASNGVDVNLIWQLQSTGTEGVYNLYNKGRGVYAGPLPEWDNTNIPVKAEQTEAGGYQFKQITGEVYAAIYYTQFAENAHSYIHHTSWSGKELVRWQKSSNASQWVISQAHLLTIVYEKDGSQLYSVEEFVESGSEYTITDKFGQVASCVVGDTPIEGNNGTWTIPVNGATTVTVKLENSLYALKTAEGTYLNFTSKEVDGGLTTQATFQDEASYLNILPLNNACAFEDSNNPGEYIGVGAAGEGWLLSKNYALWKVSEPVNGFVAISRNSNSNECLGSDENTNVGTPIFTNVGADCNKWQIVKAYPLTIVYKSNGETLGEQSVIVWADDKYTIELSDDYEGQEIVSCVATNGVAVEQDGEVWTVTATAAATVTVELKNTYYTPVVGDYVRFENRAKGGYMAAMVDDYMIRRTTDMTDGRTLWLVEAGDDGSVKLKNAATDKYMGSISQSKDVLQTATAAQFTISNISGKYMTIQETGKGNYAFANMNEWEGAFKLVGWEKSDNASQWVTSQAYPLTIIADDVKIVKAVEDGFYLITDKDVPEGKAIASCSMGGAPLPMVNGGYPVVVNGAVEVTVKLEDAKDFVTGNGSAKTIDVSTINNQNLSKIPADAGWTVSLDVENPNGAALNQWGTPILVMGNNVELNTFQLYLRATTNDKEPNKLCLVLHGAVNYISNVTATGDFSATISYDGKTTLKVETTNASGNTVTNTFTVSSALPEFTQFATNMPTGMNIENLHIDLWQNEFKYVTTAGVSNSKYIFISDKLWYNGLCNRIRFDLTESAVFYQNGKKRLSFDAFELRNAAGEKVELVAENFDGNYSKSYANMLDGVNETYCSGAWTSAEEGDDWFEITLPKGIDLGGAFSFSFVTENTTMNAKAFDIKVALDYTYIGVDALGNQVEVTYDGQPINVNDLIKDFDASKLNATDLSGVGCEWAAQVDNNNATLKVVYKRTHYIFAIDAPEEVNVTYGGNAINDGDLLEVTFNPNSFVVPNIDGYLWNLVFDKEAGTMTLVYSEIEPKVNPEAVVALVNRIGGTGTAESFRFVHDPSLNLDGETFEIGAEDGKILIKGSTLSAITTGLGWYLNNIAHINIAWNSLNETTTLVKHDSNAGYADLSYLPIPTETETHTSDAKYRYYLNTCTFGYSMTSWTWTRWQQEIDWMALHGINMPLQLVGLEEVWRTFLIKCGYSETAAKAFVAGPAFIAWWAMNNLEGWGGTAAGSKSGYNNLPGAGGVQDDAWYARQKKLAKQIVDAQRGLGMQPVLPGWSGMVPTNFADKTGYTTRGNGGNWAGDFVRPLLLNVSNANYAEIAADYYECLEEVMGESQYYSMDPFHEGGGAGTMEDYEALYAAMEVAKPGSQWVIQQWQWSATQKYSLTAVPAGRLIVLDLFSDGSPAFDGYSGYAPQEAVFCAIPNFGGRSGLMGRLQNLTDNYFKFKDKYESIKGIGAAPEAIEQTPVTYDLIFQLPWMNGVKPDVAEWVDNYAVSRYGKDNAVVKEAWSLLRQGPLNYGADGIQGPVEDVWAARPNLNANAASFWGKTLNFETAKNTYTPARRQMLIDAVYKLIDQEDELALTNSVYRSNYMYDLVEFAGGVMADYAYDLLNGIKAAKDAEKTELFNARKNAFLQLILDMDAFRGTNLNFRLGKWTQEARDAAAEVEGATTATPDWYEYNNARTIVSTWSSPGTNLTDYSYRSWQGLLKDYYYPRWEHFFNNNCTAGDYKFFEWNWAHGMKYSTSDTGISTTPLTSEDEGHTSKYTREPVGNTVEEAVKMLGKYIIPVAMADGTHYAYRYLTNDLLSKVTIIATGNSIDLTQYFGALEGATVTGDFINGTTATDLTNIPLKADLDGTYTGIITLTDGTVLTFGVTANPKYYGAYQIKYSGDPVFIQYHNVTDNGGNVGYKVVTTKKSDGTTSTGYSADYEADKIFTIVPSGIGYSLSAQGQYLKTTTTGAKGWRHIMFSEEKGDAGTYVFTEANSLVTLKSTNIDMVTVVVYDNGAWGNDIDANAKQFAIEKVENYAITIPGSGYLAVCLPFNVVLPDGVTAYDVTVEGLTSGDDGAVTTLDTIAVATEILKAGTPTLLKATAGEYTFKITMDNTSAKTSSPESKLRGNFVKQTLQPGTHGINKYVFENGAFTLLDEAQEIPANTCWIEAKIDAETVVVITGVEGKVLKIDDWIFQYTESENGSITLVDAAVPGTGDLVIGSYYTVNGKTQRVSAISPDFLHKNTDLTSITLPATMTNLGFRKVVPMFSGEYEGQSGDGVVDDTEVNPVTGKIEKQGMHRCFVFPEDPTTGKPYKVSGSFAWKLTLDVTIDSETADFNGFGSSIVSTDKNSLADYYTENMQIYMHKGHKNIVVKIDNNDDRYLYNTKVVDAEGNETDEDLVMTHFKFELEHDGAGGYQVVIYYENGHAKMYNISSSQQGILVEFDRLYYSLPEGVHVDVSFDALISEGLFVGCTNLHEIIVDPANPTFKSCDHGVLYDKNGYYVMRIPEGGDDYYSIPSKVVKLYQGAIHGVTADIVLHSNPQIGVAEGHEEDVKNAKFYLSLDDIDATITEGEKGYGGARDFTSGNANTYLAARYKRKPLAEGKFGSFMLPFVPENALNKYDFFELKAASGGCLTFTQVTELQPKTPYLYRLKENPTESTELEGDKVFGTDESGNDVFETNTPFTVDLLDKFAHDGETELISLGAYVNGYVETVNHPDSYYYAYSANDGLFHRVTKKLNYRPYRAFFVWNPEQGQAAPAKLSMRVVENDGSTTEIDPSQIEGWEEEVYYDLQGRRVLNPTNGVYIVNGRKVVIE